MVGVRTVLEAKEASIRGVRHYYADIHAKTKRIP